MESGRPVCVLHHRGILGQTLHAADMPPGIPRRSTFRRGPAQRAGRRPRAASALSRPGSDTTSSAVTSRLPCVALTAITPPARQAERRVVVDQPALFDLDMGGRADDVEAVAAQQLGSVDVVGFRDRLMFSPEPSMVGDQGAATPYPDPPQVGGDLDAPTDWDRVHRVVVAITRT